MTDKERVVHRGLTEEEIEVLSVGIVARLQEVFGRRLAALEFKEAVVPYPKWASRWGWERLVELGEAAESIVTERKQATLREAERRARLAKEPAPRKRGGKIVWTVHGFKEVGSPVRVGPR